MKQTLTLALACALLAHFPSLTFAAGSINIAWNDCAGGGGLTDIGNSCTSNSGVLILVASFTAPADMAQFNGQASVVDIQTSAATLGNWWRMDPLGPCRAGRLTGDFDFTGAPFHCFDIWAGGAMGGTEVALSSAARLRVRTVCAIPGVAPILADGTEYNVFKLTISDLATVGTCDGGCTDAACIVFNNLRITQPAGVGDYIITTGPAQYATYRGGAVSGGCPDATPTRNGTWGSIKALYR